MKNTSKILIAAAALSVGVVISCADKDSSSSSSITGTEYAGPGSEYAIVLGATQFSLTESDSGLSITGTVATLPSGFLELTVSTSNQSSPVAGDKAHVLNIPGYMTLLKPLGGDDQIITMLKAGTCPTSNLDLNWIVTDSEDSGDLTSDRDSWGTFSWDSSTGAATIPTKFYVDSSFTSAGTNESLGSFTCASGVGTVGGAKMYFTPGGVIVNTDTVSEADRNIIIGTYQDTIGTMAALDGNYIGLVFNDVTDAVSPAKMSASSGTFTVNEMDVDTGATGAALDTLNMAGADSPSAGFFKGDIAGSNKVVCMASADVAGSGKDLIFCVGHANGGTTSDRYSGLFISQ